METELVKVLQLKYPTISYTNKLYEGNKKTLLTQTLHHKTLKLLPKIKTFFQLWRAANFALLRKLLRSYFVMIIRTLTLSPKLLLNHPPPPYSIWSIHLFIYTCV